MKIISTGRTLVSGSRGEQFQIGAPNISSPQFVTLTGGNGNFINNCNGHNALIKVGGGENVIINSDAAVNATVVCSTGNDSIVNSTGAKNSSIVTGNGSDTVDIWSSEATIKFGNGSNLVRICADTKLSLDVSTSDSYELKYFNGAKADVTLINGETYTLRGSADENIFDYAGGNMIIESYGGEDLIRIRQAFGAAKVSGDDVIIPVGNGSIVVKNARAHTLNINGHKMVVGSYASGSTPQQVIKKFMAALDRTKLRGISAVDEAVRKSSKFSDADEVIACMINDCKRLRNADKFLRDCCNIILDNADTGAITGWDAGNSIVKTNESIVNERGALKIFRGQSFIVNGLKVNVPSNPRGVQQNIINGLYSWWVKNVLDLIEESYGVAYRFDAPNVSVRELNVEFINDDTSALATVNHRYNAFNGRANALTLRINMKYYNELNSHDVNGSTAFNRGNIRASFLDRTLAHEFTHAVMAANIDFFSDLPAWLKEGTAELTHGISDERRNDLETLAGDPNKLYNALKSHTSDAAQIHVKNVLAPVYAAGFMLLHYFAKKVANMP